MTPMALWQRVVFMLGEALLVAGLLWGAYRVIFLRVCPVGPINDLTLIVAGLAISILPLHPFGAPAAPPAPGYLVHVPQRLPLVAATVWLTAVLGAAVSLWARLSGQPGLYWFIALAPAILYYLFGIAFTRGETKVKPAGTAGGDGRDA